MSASPRQVVGPDGRRISFDVHGDPSGPPVLVLHGVPSSRLETHVFGVPDAARRAGVQVIAIDRPGIGGTDPRPGRALSDTADDVAAVADALGHSRFALLGYSAGSPFALATAERLAGRVTTLGIVSGIAPGDRPDLTVGQVEEVARMFRWARSEPRRLRAMLRAMRLGVRLPKMLVRSAGKGAPAADLEVLARDGAAEHFAAFLAAAFRQGIDGVAEDFAVAAGDWAFSLEGIALPVRIWHGAQDRNAPVAAAHWLDEQLADSVLTVGPEDGHASMLSTHAQNILAELTSS